MKEIWYNCIYAYNIIYTILYFALPLCIKFKFSNWSARNSAFACIGWLHHSFDYLALYFNIIHDNRVSAMPKAQNGRCFASLQKSEVDTSTMRSPSCTNVCVRVRNRWLDFHTTFRTDIFAQASWIVWHCWAFFHMAHMLSCTNKL
jgi:hypothetical protein